MSTALTVTAPSGTQTLVWAREIDAPPEVVFAVMMAADAIPAWWGPGQLETTVVAHEPRTGGSWRYQQVDDEGHTFVFHGVFHEVRPAERVVQTFEFDGVPEHVTLDTLELEPVDGRTRVLGQSVFQSVEDRDAMIASGMERGLAESYDRLEAVVTSRR